MPSKTKKKSIHCKQLQNEIQTLVKDLDCSRIAVENIAVCAASQQRYKQNVQQMQQQLQKCITKLAQQNTKRNTLYELLSLMNGEMHQFQVIQKNQLQQSKVKNDKRIKLCQVKIQKINQKHNQQIQKINKLKQLANSRRSQRVVCSNLLKKLQKQIKHYEQIYKQQLICNQLSKNRTKKQGHKSDKNIIKQFDINENQKNIQQIFNTNYQNSMDDSRRNSSLGGIKSRKSLQPSIFSAFINTKTKGKDTKFYTIRQQNEKQVQKDIFKKTGFKQDRLLYTKNLLKKISQMNMLIETVKIKSEKESTQKLLKHYSKVQDENEEIRKSIMQVDQQIRQIQMQTKEINNQQRYENYVKPVNSSMEIDFQTKESQYLYQQNQFNQLSQQFYEIAQLLQIKNIGSEKKVPNQEVIQQLDQKLNSIRQYFKINKDRGFRQEADFSETIVTCLLEKMQKFNDCQKVFDKKTMKDEYYRELGKKRQVRTRKLGAKQIY